MIYWKYYNIWRYDFRHGASLSWNFVALDAICPEQGEGKFNTNQW